MAERSLEEILMSMESLNGVENEEQAKEPGSDETKALFDEPLANELAMTFLGKDYDPSCTYRLVSQPTETVVVKINPKISPDSEPVYDDKGNIISAHMMEYTLHDYDEQDAREVVDAMLTRDERDMRGINIQCEYFRTADMVPVVKRSRFRVVMVFISIAMLLAWVAVMYLIYLYGGMRIGF